jgi:hypothetical protein
MCGPIEGRKIDRETLPFAFSMYLHLTYHLPKAQALGAFEYLEVWAKV